MFTKVHRCSSEGAQVVRGTVTQELESQGRTQPGKHQCNAVGSQGGTSRGVQRSDQASEGRHRGAKTATQPTLGSCSLLVPKGARGTQPRAQPASDTAHIAASTSPCRCRPPRAGCTACTPRSSTSAPGTGRAVLPLGSACCGHAHSRCSRSSSHGGTCGQQCRGRSGQPGRS